MSTKLLNRVAGLQKSSNNSAHFKILLLVRPQNLLISSVLLDGKTRKMTRAATLDDFKEKRSYWGLREEAVYRAVRRTRSVRVYGTVSRETTWFW